MLRCSCVHVAILAIAVSIFSLNASAQQIPKESTGVAKFDAAVKKAVLHLQAQLAKPGQIKKLPEAALTAYTMIKAGVPHNDPGIQRTVAEVKALTTNGQFRATNSGPPPLEHVYFTGVYAMLLAADDPVAHLPELKAIASYLVEYQYPDGSWDYPVRTTGDTSMCQYGVLGLWACVRAGAEVPPTVWDKCLNWHATKKNGDGGWGYHPGSQAGPGQGASTHNMSYGATGSMAICRLILFPDYAPGGKKNKPVKKKLFGVLEEVETGADTQAASAVNLYPSYTPTTSIQKIDSAIGNGIGWLGSRFRTSNPSRGYPMYFYYAMERSLAMNDVKKIGGQDWYRACGDELVKTQEDDGSWNSASNHAEASTCFGVLFFIKSTAKLLDAFLGKGTQVGKRGFDLDNPDQGKKKKKLGPLDEMLARMENMNVQGIQDVPEEDLSALVEKILQTPRKELAKHLTMLKKLKDNPRGDVRRVVMFGLGRSGDMRVAPILIDALNDNDVSVLNEAHTALCYISRKPRGFDLIADIAGEVEGLPQTEIDTTVNKWRKQAQGRWRAWYKRIRPYDEQGDLWEVSGAPAATGSK